MQMLEATFSGCIQTVSGVKVLVCCQQSSRQHHSILALWQPV